MCSHDAPAPCRHLAAACALCCAQAIVQLVDNFLNKRGKFAIPGYPHKLGFLLHGPPGTGKTSFIKVRLNPLCRTLS